MMALLGMPCLEWHAARFLGVCNRKATAEGVHSATPSCKRTKHLLELPFYPRNKTRLGSICSHHFVLARHISIIYYLLTPLLHSRFCQLIFLRLHRQHARHKFRAREEQGGLEVRSYHVRPWSTIDKSKMETAFGIYIPFIWEGLSRTGYHGLQMFS